MSVEWVFLDAFGTLVYLDHPFERLQAALAEAGHAVQLQVELGAVKDCPARRNALAATQRQKAAEAVLMADPFVQEMMREFGAKIVPGSVKPL